MSKLIRRSHMYLALFLSPWLIMYAASTFVMNHRAWFHPAPQGPPPFQKEREQTFRGRLPEEAAPRDIAVAVLRDLDIVSVSSLQREGRRRADEFRRSLSQRGITVDGFHVVTGQPEKALVSLAARKRIGREKR